MNGVFKALFVFSAIGVWGSLSNLVFLLIWERADATQKHVTAAKDLQSSYPEQSFNAKLLSPERIEFELNDNDI